MGDTAQVAHFCMRVALTEITTHTGTTRVMPIQFHMAAHPLMGATQLLVFHKGVTAQFVIVPIPSPLVGAVTAQFLDFRMRVTIRFPSPLMGVAAQLPEFRMGVTVQFPNPLPWVTDHPHPHMGVIAQVAGHVRIITQVVAGHMGVINQVRGHPHKGVIIQVTDHPHPHVGVITQVVGHIGVITQVRGHPHEGVAIQVTTCRKGTQVQLGTSWERI